MQYIDCKTVAQKWKDRVKALSLPAKLCIIQAGDDPASNAYVKGKLKDCSEVGFAVDYRHIELNDSTVSDDCLDTAYIREKQQKTRLLEQIIEILKEVGSDKAVNGIIVQLPLPYGITFEDFSAYIPHEKDVDGFLDNSPFAPCTPAAVMDLITNELGIELPGKKCVVAGRSKIVGKPLAKMLLEMGATVTVCHSHTPHHVLEMEAENANVYISAVGLPNMLDADVFSYNTTVIDVGISRVGNRLCGDIMPPAIVRKYDDGIRITPVPGGVGLLTRAMLLRHLALAYEIQNTEKKNEI